MKSPGKKSERLSQLELLLVTHPEGLRRAEIARRLGVHRATVGRYIDELSTHVPIWERDYLIGIKSNQKNTLMKLSLLESLTFYLAFRSLQKNLGIRFPAGASAIRKISRFLHSYAPFLSSRMTEISDFLDSGDRKESIKISLWLEILAEAWITARPVKVCYMEGQNKVENHFTVCSIDPDNMGNTEGSLLICLRKISNGQHTVHVKFDDLLEVDAVPAAVTIPVEVYKNIDNHDDIFTGEHGDVVLLVMNSKYIELLKQISPEKFETEPFEDDPGISRCTVNPDADELLLGLVAASGGDLIIEAPICCVEAFARLRLDIARRIDSNLLKKD